MARDTAVSRSSDWMDRLEQQHDKKVNALLRVSRKTPTAEKRSLRRARFAACPCGSACLKRGRFFRPPQRLDLGGPGRDDVDTALLDTDGHAGKAAITLVRHNNPCRRLALPPFPFPLEAFPVGAFPLAPSAALSNAWTWTTSTVHLPKSKCPARR